MRTSERQAGDISIIDAKGRIQFGDGADEFREAMTKVVESGHVKVVVNMSEVPYVDSAGISELIRVFVTVGKRGGQMKLLNLTRRVHELLEITKLLGVFESFDSEEEAVASFSSAA